ncbi:MAG: flagellar hook-basal body complex protein FliE, partial [Deltaproteobacteria bacterium]|nr:flagellar hook-basal body complex protein FliE [Deltaproteobacteria bacterium]
TFGTMLKDVIQEVDQLQKEADESVKKLAMGEGKTIHETMIALEKAGISFQLMIEVRNKIIAAYEEVMRMQI